ncbi:MAG: hypothetical protein IKX85_05360, partial [Clostridia bacterium]|nr:hypothetical protein [Clostridia bacterium]
MKRSLSLLGAFLLLLLLLSACRLALSGTAGETSSAGSEQDPASAEEEAPPLSPGLYELLRFDNDGENEFLLSSAVRGNEAIVCASKSKPASEEGEELFLIFADLQTGKVSERVPLDPYYDPDHPEPPDPDPWSEIPGLYLSRLAIGDNGTLVLSGEGADWAALYDRSGRLLDMIPYGPSGGETYYAEYPLLPRSAGVWDGFSAYSFPDDRGKNISAFSFLDDPSAVYLFENEYRS